MRIGAFTFFEFFIGVFIQITWMAKPSRTTKITYYLLIHPQDKT
jgi:hypothetical protein